MRRTIEIQQSTAKMRAKRKSSMAHEIAKIRMRQDAVGAARPAAAAAIPAASPFGVRKAGRRAPRHRYAARAAAEYDGEKPWIAPSATARAADARPARPPGAERARAAAPPVPQLDAARIRRPLGLPPREGARRGGGRGDGGAATARRVASDPHRRRDRRAARARRPARPPRTNHRRPRRHARVGDEGDTAIVREKKWTSCSRRCRRW